MRLLPVDINDVATKIKDVEVIDWITNLYEGDFEQRPGPATTWFGLEASLGGVHKRHCRLKRYACPKKDMFPRDSMR